MAIWGSWINSTVRRTRRRATLDPGLWIVDSHSAAGTLTGAMTALVGSSVRRSSMVGRQSRMVFVLCILYGFAANAFAQQRQAQLSWWDRAIEEKVGNYWIKTDVPPEEAISLARHLNFMYGEYSKRLADMPVRAQEKLNVLIFKERREYELTLLARFGVNAGGTGGMFFVNSQGNALAFWTQELPRRRIEHVIQHEGFHQFAYSRFGNDLPIWVNEGLAEFFGESLVVGDTFIIGQTTPRVLDSVKNAIELKTYIPFQQMLTMTPRQWGAAMHLSNGSAPLQYAQAWSMVHFLVYGDGGKYVGAFEIYLKHLNNGLPPREAFVRSFGNDIEAFESRWKQYALAAKPSAFVTATERIQFLAEGALELSRQNIYPQTLDELRQKLKEIKFTHTLDTHGTEVKLPADDDALYTIPLDHLSDPEEPPVFTLQPFNPHRLPAREQALEERNPTPPTISTEHLRPREMSVKWIRDPELNVFSYQIVVK